MKRIIAALSIAYLVSSCGDGDAPGGFIYRVNPSTMPGGALEGSLLTISSPLGGIPPLQEPISGSFVASERPLHSADELFRFELSNIHLQSQSYRIDANGGEMLARTGGPAQFTMTFAGTINGQPIAFHGENASDTFAGNPPVLTNVSLTNEGGYVLRIFAAPTS